MLAKELYKKWGEVLEHKDLPELKAGQRKFVTAHCLENTETALRESGQFGSQQLLGEAVPTNALPGGTPGQRVGGDANDHDLLSMINGQPDDVAETLRDWLGDRRG